MRHEQDDLKDYDIGTQMIIATIFAVAINKPEEIQEKYFAIADMIYDLGEKQIMSAA